MSRRDWRLPAPATPVVFAFWMAAIMALLMCSVITLANTGLTAGVVGRIGHAYVVAMPAAFCCVLLVRPVVVRLVARCVRPN